MDLDALDDQADDLLAVGRSRLGRTPKRREVARPKFPSHF
jgi:hypothetical protein